MKFLHIYLYLTNIELSDFNNFDTDEVSSFIEIKIDELLKLLLGGKTEIEGKIDNKIVKITLSNFVENYLKNDKLYLRLAIAAKRFIKGEDPKYIFW